MRALGLILIVATASGGCAGSKASGVHSAGPSSSPAPLFGGDGPAMVLRDAVMASVSPDGTQLAYARMPDDSGISVRNLRTGATRELTAPGKRPAWSPDGAHIAYVIGEREKGLDGEAVW